MLSKFFRLTKLDIARVFKKGRTYKGSNFTFRFFPNRTDHPRYSIIIPKTVLPHATDRNRLKRMISENLTKISFKNNLDITVQVKKLVEEKDIAAQLNDGFQKITVARWDGFH